MRYLLTGGSGCGKSYFAERLAMKFELPRYYLAAMRPVCEEDRQRIIRHRALRRGKNFETIERYADLGGLTLPSKGVILLECLCNLTANEIFDPDGAGENAVTSIIDGVKNLERQSEVLIAVTNDVSSEGGKRDILTEKYLEALCLINRKLAARFENVYELCCGLPTVLKGEL